MKHNRLIYIITAAVLVVMGLLAGCSFGGDYVAKVAGEKVTTTEYNFFLYTVKNTMLQENQDKLPDANAVKAFWATKPDGNKTAEDIAKEKALISVQELKIQLLKAKQSNIVLTKTEMDSIKSQIDSMEKSVGDKTAAQQAFMSQFGVTRDQFEEVYREIATISKFSQGEQAKIQVTDDEAKKYYDEHKDELDQVTVRHILISTVDASQNPLPQDKQDAAKKKADEILAKVNAGGDFAALAKENSEDPGSKDAGGVYTFGKGKMVKEFEDWSFNAKPGDTGIVKSAFGYHVMKFDKRSVFDDVKDAAKAAVKKDKYSKQVDEWKKDKQYEVVTNPGVYNTIKIQ